MHGGRENIYVTNPCPPPRGSFVRRNVELAHKNSGDVRALRDELDPEYQKIVKRMNALVTLEMSTAEIDSFIRELNQRIKYYKETIEARAGRADAKAEETVE